MRALPLACLLLSGCSWWDSAPLPQPATDSGLSSAESSLDHLTDKRDSRVAAAIDVAKEASTEDRVRSELDVAGAMLPAPTSADLAYARERLAKGDDAFYAEQVAVSRALAQSILKANADYEREKARKQAEYESRLKEREMALAAEQEARQADKWTYAGIGLTALGLLAAFLTPLKLRGAGVAVAGVLIGSFPVISKEPYFPYLIGGIALTGIIAAFALNRRKPDDAAPPSQG